MATIYVRVTDDLTGQPVSQAAVTVRLAGAPDTTPPLATGFTTRLGDYYATVPNWYVVTRAQVWTITVAATGYTTGTGTLAATTSTTYNYLTTLTPAPVTLPPPALTYPALVGVGQAPDLVVDLSGFGGYEDVLVHVTGAFPSTSVSPVLPTGPVSVPMAARLLVAPPDTLSLISHAERVRPARDLTQLYTLTVSGRVGNWLTTLGTLVTTALLVDVPGDVMARLAASPWLTPWPGAVPVERGGYAEVVFALPTPLTTPLTYNLFLTAHADGVDGPVTYQDTLTLTVPVSPLSYQAYRVRLPDYDTPALRLLLYSDLNNLPPLWAVYRSF